LYSFKKSLLTAALIGIGALVLPLAGNAQVLTITISDNLGHSLTVTDMGAGDSNAAANGVIIDSSLLTTFMPNLAMGSNVSAVFAQPSGTSVLTFNGNLVSTVGVQDVTYTTFASITGVTVPPGTNKQFFDTNAINFGGGGKVGVVGTDRDGISTANTLNTFGQSDTFNYVSTSVNPNGSGAPGPGFLFATNNPFSITSQNIITLVGGSNVQWQTNSTVAASAVPEPGSVAMLAGLGVTGSLFASRKLRRRN